MKKMQRISQVNPAVEAEFPTGTPARAVRELKELELDHVVGGAGGTNTSNNNGTGDHQGNRV